MNIFKKRKKDSSDLFLKDHYNFSFINHDNIGDFPDGIEEIYEGRRDGFVIKRFLDTSLIGNIKSRLGELEKSQGLTFKNSEIIGHPLNMVVDDMSEYFKKSPEFSKVWLDFFGLDLESKLRECFQKFAENKTVEVPEIDGQKYAFGNLRIFRTGKGGLLAHTGNEFFELNRKKGMRWLAENALMMNSMSYFILVKKPESGGELILFDKLWSDPETDQLRGFNNNLKESPGFDKLKRQVIEMDEGDLVFFNGGRIWHKVTNPIGNWARYSFGGFMALSNKKDKAWFWG